MFVPGHRLMSVLPLVEIDAPVVTSAEPGGVEAGDWATQITRHGVVTVPGLVSVIAVLWVSAWIEET
jgi:hypothetical protein